MTENVIIIPKTSAKNLLLSLYFPFVNAKIKNELLRK